MIWTPTSMRGSRRSAYGAVAVAVSLIAGGLVAAAPPAGAVTAWSVVPSPSVSSVSALRGVSCPSVTSCFAVGTENPTSTSARTLVERWDGHKWSVMPTPNPAAAIAGLFGVSCPNTVTCFAVGLSAATPTSANKTLIERWDGKRWTVMASPSPTGPAIFLLAISCVTVTSCVAVGTTNGAGGNAIGKTLAERWNGRSWTVTPSPNVTGAFLSELSGVSCSGTSCFAVGVSDKSGLNKTLVERWNGTTWAIVASPNPSIAGGGGGLQSVSCSAAASCDAVGSWEVGFGETGKTLAEHWNGTRWSITATPSPPGSAYSELNGVSCPTTSNCTAVGDSYNGTAMTDTTLAEHWNGHSWSMTTIPNPSSQSYLPGIACPSVAGCFGVGSMSSGSSTATLVERYA